MFIHLYPINQQSGLASFGFLCHYSLKSLWGWISSPRKPYFTELDAFFFIIQILVEFILLK